MGTPFDEVIDMSLITIRDYKLDKLYMVDKTTFDLVFEGFLTRVEPDFICFQSLDYDLLSKSFISTLTRLEISILADLIVMCWFTSKVQDVTEFQGHMSDREFKKHSEANNLAKKTDYLDGLREKLEQKTTRYSLVNLDKCGL